MIAASWRLHLPSMSSTFQFVQNYKYSFNPLYTFIYTWLLRLWRQNWSSMASTFQFVQNYKYSFNLLYTFIY